MGLETRRDEACDNVTEPSWCWESNHGSFNYRVPYQWSDARGIDFDVRCSNYDWLEYLGETSSCLQVAKQTSVHGTQPLTTNFSVFDRFTVDVTVLALLSDEPITTTTI